MRRPVLVRVLLAAALSGPLTIGARAEPLALSDEAALDRFAAYVAAYKDASRVRWVVEAKDPAARQRVLAALADRLGAEDAALLERVEAVSTVASTRSLSEGMSDATDVPRVHITVAPPPDRACSWRVTVADPEAPSQDPGGAAIPIERGDVIPTSPKATFEVGFSGPLQSTLYAFAETAPGSLRDLAAAPEIAIPVDGAADETLVLVRARRPVPFLDGLRSALGSKPGERVELGRNSALGDRFRNGGRGIGANIQLVDPGMIVAQLEPQQERPAPEPAKPRAEEVPIARADDLVETCLYTVTRLPAVN